MVNKKIWLGMLVMVLLLGMAFVGSLEAQIDNRLNGTWVTTDAEGTLKELTMSNGNFEQSGAGINFHLFSRGTYTANREILNMRTTHFMAIGMEEIGLEAAKWYTTNELTNIFKKYFIDSIPENIIDEIISFMIAGPQGSYSIVSNSLIVSTTFEGETETVVYTKK